MWLVLAERFPVSQEQGYFKKPESCDSGFVI